MENKGQMTIRPVKYTGAKNSHVCKWRSAANEPTRADRTEENYIA